MTALSTYVDGIAVLGAGLPDWPTSQPILAGERIYAPAAAALPAIAALPPAERRRTGRVVRLAIALGLAAAEDAGVDPMSLPAVFSSSGGDGENCHEICRALASSDRSISPTRFHNSVHNAPAGYWSIATRALAASTALCAYDGSFAAGYLEAAVQTALWRQTTLLIAYDSDYPSPLREKRPIAEAFGIALVLAAAQSARSVAQVRARLSDEPVDCLRDPGIETLRASAPAARGLPLLVQIARRQPGITRLEYLDRTSLRLEVVPC